MSLGKFELVFDQLYCCWFGELLLLVLGAVVVVGIGSILLLLVLGAVVPIVLLFGTVIVVGIGSCRCCY